MNSEEERREIEEMIKNEILKKIVGIQETASLLQTTKIIRAQIQRNVTKEGIKCSLPIGADCHIHLDSIKNRNIEFRNGNKADVATINRVDEFGNDLGWTCVEFFFL